MKNQNVLRILALVFAVAMMLTIASCDMLDKLLGKEPATTPVETTTEAPHEHAWGEPTETKAPTCTEKGENTYTCACGETKTEEIAELGHTVVAIPAKDATCKENGSTAGEMCEVCEVVLVEPEIIDKATVAHTPNIEAPTCTAAQVCTVCNATIAQKVAHTPGAAATCTTAQKCTVCQTEVAPALNHTYYRDFVNNPQRFNATYGICLDCGDIQEAHEHIIKDGKCKYCEFELFSLPCESIIDFDKNGFNEVYIMANALYERFRAENVIVVNAHYPSASKHNGSWDNVKNDGKTTGVVPYGHKYNTDAAANKAEGFLEYKVNVPEAGIYELAMHIRIKDITYREGKFIVNGEDAFAFTYGFTSYYKSGSPNMDGATPEQLKIQNDAFLVGSYVYGFQVKLNAGENTIKVVAPGVTAKTQHYRNFFLIKWDCAQAGHTYKNGACTVCGFEHVEHTWVDATCTTPKTCSTCFKTEGEVAGTHDWNANYTECELCHVKVLTAKEAYDIGMTYAEGQYGTDKYYVLVTLDQQVNTNGFGRGTLVADLEYLSVGGGYTDNGILLGDTVLLYGTLGAVNSALAKNDDTKEARMANVTLVKNISATCEHAWSEATECGAKYTCSKCNAVRIVAHKWNEELTECTVCGQKVIDVDKAIELGKLQPQKTGNGDAPADTWSTDYYYVKVTFNNGAPNPKSNPVGFCRVFAADGTTKMGIKSITLIGGQTLPVENDTVILRCKLGYIATEVRLYDVTLYEVISTAPAAQ